MKILEQSYFKRNTEAAPLAAFRIFFGLMMLISIIRFWSNGWIDKLYIQPKFFFPFYGFEFVKPLGQFTYLVFVVCGIAAILVMLGYQYRIAIIVFFLSFTYIELMDKTTYLNHYYFITIVSFLMIFLPANVYFSIDAHRSPKKSFQSIPKWNIDALKLLLGIIYFYSGLAKLNSDWLFKAMPLKIWLPAKYDLPLLGDWLQNEWVHYVFSWSGALYDLTIPFLLLYKRTRVPAFVGVVMFHVFTRVLFPIGMFPYIMIVSALIFFDSDIHKRILDVFAKLTRTSRIKFDNGGVLITDYGSRYRIKVVVITAFFLIQFLLPLRDKLYPDELFWTEEGYRFSWRVMLMEKAGYANFKVVDTKTRKRFYVDNSDFLTPFQEKQMATQPDFILAYAHYLKEYFEGQGHQNLGIFVESYVALNGRLSQPYINPKVDLTQFKESFKHKLWILPFNDEIKGF